MQCAEIKKSNRSYITLTFFLCLQRIVGNEKKKKSLAIIQKNNNICTRSFGQKVIMFSTVGWRGELHDRILTRFISLVFPKTLLQHRGWTENEPNGIALFKFLCSLTWAFVCHCTVSAHCSHVISYRLSLCETEQPCRKAYSVHFFSATWQHWNCTSNIWKIPLKCDRRHRWAVSLCQWMRHRQGSVCRGRGLTKQHRVLVL